MTWWDTPVVLTVALPENIQGFLEKGLVTSQWKLCLNLWTGEPDKYSNWTTCCTPSLWILSPSYTSYINRICVTLGRLLSSLSVWVSQTFMCFPVHARPASHSHLTSCFPPHVALTPVFLSQLLLFLPLSSSVAAAAAVCCLASLRLPALPPSGRRFSIMCNDSVLSAGFQIDTPDSLGRTCLHAAAAGGWAYTSFRKKEEKDEGQFWCFTTARIVIEQQNTGGVL